MRRIAIADIHGFYCTFKELIEQQVKLTKTDELFLLGDYIERGPDSFGVLEYIFDLIQKGYKVRCLLGNHEDMLLNDPAKREHFHKYVDFFQHLPLLIEADDFVLVHAGFHSDFEDPFEYPWILLNVRGWENEMENSPALRWIGKRMVIYGHNPRQKEKIIESVKQHKQFIPIDNGCYFTEKESFGSLCAFDFTNYELYFQKNIDLET